MARHDIPSYDHLTISRLLNTATEAQDFMEQDPHEAVVAAPSTAVGLPRGGGPRPTPGSTPATTSAPASASNPQVSHLIRDPDPEWEIAMSSRQKRRQRGGPVLAGTPHGNIQSQNAAMMSGAAPAAPGEGVRGGAPPPRRRLPPLPREDLKIVLRPKGLAVKDLHTHQVARAVVAATGQGCKAEDFIVRLRNGSNIIIISTNDEEAAQKIRRITELTFGGKSYAMNSHVAAPEGTLRGVIHGVDPGTPAEELKANLRVRTQGVKVLAARMLGRSSTAVVTFDGPRLPKQVIYYGGEMWCYAYRPTRQVCYACGQQGHRTDVCPSPESKTCRQCGSQNPVEGHECTPKCLLCGGDHAAGTKDCKMRLKTASELRWGKPPQPQQQRRSRSKSHGGGGARRPRWFSDEGDESQQRGRSRSRSRDRDGSWPPPPPKGQQPKKQQQQKQGGVKVSWGAGPPITLFPDAPHSNPNTDNTKDKIIEELRKENQQLRRQLNDIIKELQEIRRLGFVSPPSYSSPIRVASPPKTPSPVQQVTGELSFNDKLESFMQSMQQMQQETQKQMKDMQKELQNTQQKMALQEQGFRNYIKNQNTQKIIDSRERLFNERRFGGSTETLGATNPSTSTTWQETTN